MSLGESRSELLSWVNQLLDTDFKKVEQLGTGAAYCQIFDSIYRDVPMSRVKFQASYDYEYNSNYKVLQAAFVKHGVTKSVPVEKLLKCKLQDNLEFLQWFKKFWNENKDDSFYDPNSRRKNTNSGGNNNNVKRSGSSVKSSSIKSTNSSFSSTGRKSAISSLSNNSTPSAISNNKPRQVIHHSTISSKSRVFSPSSNHLSNNNSSSTMHSTMNNHNNNNSINADTSHLKSQLEQTEHKLSAATTQLADTQQQLRDAETEIEAMSSELTELQIAAEGLETERNFYFNKLRDIEILSQAITEKLSEQADEQYRRQMSGETVTEDVLKNNQGLIDFVEKVQDILYLTEEGFQLPDEEQEDEQQEEDEEEADQYYRESIKGNDILQNISMAHEEDRDAELEQEDVMRVDSDQMLDGEEECF